MAVNPASMLKLLSELKRFGGRHPKAVRFVEKELLTDIPEGTVLEISLTKPGRGKATANIRIKAEDLEFFEALRNVAD